MLLFAQSSNPVVPVCHMPDIPPEEENFIPDCSSQSPYYSSPLENLPSLEADFLTVKVNFIILQRNDGTGNFQDIPEHRDFLNSAVGWANGRMRTLDLNDPNCQSPDNRIDTKIRYDVNLVFYQDPTLDNFFWNRDNCNSDDCCPAEPNWYLNPLDEIIRNDPNIPLGINYYLTTSETQMNEILDENGDCIANEDTDLPEGGSCGEFPSRTNLTLSSRVHGPNYWLAYEYRKNCEEVYGGTFDDTEGWLKADLSYYLRHEVGHNYLLFHRCGVNATCNGDNVMTGTNDGCHVPGPAVYFDNVQIGTMHRALGRSNLRQFVCCDDTYGVPRLVSSDEIWDFDQRLYQDVIVQSGATLRLTCNHLMPKDGKIVVERGARLIIDGATVSRANTCGGEEKWDGIYLRGNNEKGHTPSMLDENSPLEPDNPAILIIKNTATIEYATRAIQTENSGFGLPYSEKINMRNGLVSVTDAVFRNNYISCGFNNDDQEDGTPNLNLSHFTRCDFIDEDGTADFGVVNWRTDNVLFDDCEFNGLNRDAIQALTAGITIKNSRFYENGTGVFLGASGLLNQPISIGTSNEPNEFKQNGTGIRALGINNLNVNGNAFNNNGHGIFCMGESQFVIQDNGFENNIYSIGLQNTGKSFNLSSCNDYKSNPFFSLNIYGQGENSGIQFKEETFMSPVYNVLLTNAGNIPGKFGPQGANGNARFNYFQHNSLSSRFATSGGSTEPFLYWYPNQNGSNSETRPFCTLNENANCTVTNNFVSLRTGGQSTDCTENGSEENSEISKESLANLWSEEKNIKEQIANSGSSHQLESTLNQVSSNKEYVIAGLMQEWLEVGNFTAIENMLTEEDTPHATKKLISLRLLTQDYAGANSLINQLPNTQEAYKRIQLINLDRLTTNEYILPENDEEFLQLTAIQKIPEAALAQSMLNLLKKENFAIIPPEIPANVYSEEETEIEGISSRMIIAPNPARDLIRIDFSTQLVLIERQLSIFNTQGVKIYSIKVGEGETSRLIKLDDFSPGLYYLNVLDKEGNTETQKFMIQR